MNKIGIIGKDGKVFREFLLLLVVLSFLLIFVIADDDFFTEDATFETFQTSDPWSEDNFKDSFLLDPAAGFQQNPEMAWQTLESDPYMLISTPDFAATAFDNDPSRVVAIINSNTQLLVSSPTLLQEFDSQIVGKVHLLNDNPNAKQTWLKEKFKHSITMASSTTKIVGYDGATVQTETASFSPDLLPTGASYKIMADGTLQSTGKFSGTFTGDINYDLTTGTLNSDTGFTDKSKTEFACSANCMIQVGEDGTVVFLQGEGEVNGIGVANLHDVSMTNGIINAKPDQLGSFVDGSELFSEDYLNYNPEKKIFYGASNLQVISTSGDKLFIGEEISFLDQDGNVVANLLTGETRFVLGSGECLPGSCIQVNPQNKEITITAAKHSVVKIHSEGYDSLNFKEVKDDSQILVEEKGVRTVLVNKRGIHPYQDLTGLKKKMSYEIETADGDIATHVNNNGVDEVCVGDKCQVCTIQKCEA